MQGFKHGKRRSEFSFVFFFHLFINRENTLYWYLIDILRSPEMIKQMTGSLYTIITEKAKFK